MSGKRKLDPLIEELIIEVISRRQTYRGNDHRGPAYLLIISSSKVSPPLNPV